MYNVCTIKGMVNYFGVQYNQQYGNDEGKFYPKHMPPSALPALKSLYMIMGNAHTTDIGGSALLQKIGFYYCYYLLLCSMFKVPYQNKQ
jgi:hypothetical protein